jgi:beta-phosphoglucomutase-like phosphatase (HAD superfamily)
MNKIDLVLFDCDGTLIDSEYVNNKSISEMIIGLGHKQFTLPYCIDYFAGCSVHDVINTLNRLGIEDHNAALEKMHQHAIGIARKELMAIKHVAETLEKITVPKCVVSNGENAIVREFLAITELAKFFKIDNIFTCELVIFICGKKNGKFLPRKMSCSRG